MNSVLLRHERENIFLQRFKLMGLGSQCLVFSLQSDLVLLGKKLGLCLKKKKWKKRKKNKEGDTWKSLAAPCVRRAVRLGVSQPGLGLHCCWIILCATLVKSFVSFAPLSLALHAKLPGGIWQKGAPSQWCITAVTPGPDWEPFLSASVRRSLQEQSSTELQAAGKKKGHITEIFYCFTLYYKIFISVVLSDALTLRIISSISGIHCIYILYCCF